MKIKFYILIFAVFNLIAVSAHSSLFVKVDFDELASRSEAIVQGKVTKINMEWNEDHSMIFTYVDFKVSRIFKGNLSAFRNHIIIKEAGGKVGSKSVRPIGFPRFRVGKESILFLTRWPDGNYRILGYSQGKYNIIKDRLTREKRYIREDYLQGNPVISNEDSYERKLTCQGPLSYLISEIKRALKD